MAASSLWGGKQGARPDRFADESATLTRPDAHRLRVARDLRALSHASRESEGSELGHDSGFDRACGGMTMDPSKRLTLVVGIDFSDLSLEAMRVGLELAKTSGDAHLHLVHVVPLPASTEIPVDASALEADATLQMADLRARALEKGRAAVTAHVVVGAPAEALTLFAKKTRADLMVVGTHGRRGLSRLAFGSVAEAVVRTAPCSVLTVRTRVLSPEERIEPPCPQCVEAQRATGGKELWCARHREHHPRPHTHSELPEGFALGSMNLRFPER
jgi:nucleotide-binding universal stress UspA family protein